MKKLLLASVALVSIGTASAATFPSNTTPAWKSYMATGNTADIVSSPTVAAAIGGKVDATNGQSLNQTLQSPTITGGTLSGTSIASVNLSASTSTATGGNTSRTLADRANDTVSVLDYGASPTASAATNGTAVTSALAAAQASSQWLNFPYRSAGYSISGTFTNNALGYFNFGGNVLSGAGIGTPGTGAGTLNSLYTNPYLIVTGIKYELDPAGQAVPAAGSANIGWAIECRPNRPNSGDKSTTVRMVACGYIGADTGTGGSSGTEFTMEDLNPVLNISTNSGTGIEQDVNFNGTVNDGGVSRGLFVTGGGAAGNNTLSVALDIQHSAYDGTWLPWTTGISIRNATNQIMQYKSTDSEAGFFQEAFNVAGNAIWKVDKNGYNTAAGYTTSGNVTATGTISTNGGITSTTTGANGINLKAANADDIVITAASTSDSGFAMRLFSPTTQTLFSLDKNGYAVASGFTTSGNVTASTISASSNLQTSGKVCLDSSCTRYVYESGSKIYIGNTTNGNIASFDDSGNMTLKGTLTQSGTP